MASHAGKRNMHDPERNLTQIQARSRASHANTHVALARSSARSLETRPSMSGSIAGAPPVVPAPHRQFIVLKGYHMGSKWFSQTLNALPGAAFYFEYEHCLRSLGRSANKTAKPSGGPERAAVPASLASPGVTLHYLRTACNCANSCNGCHGDTTTAAKCLATGISFGALGSAYVDHVRAVLQHAPHTAIVAHVRTNHLKHAFSFFRTTCGGEVNHLRADGRPDRGRRLGNSVSLHHHRMARLRVPPPLLLLRALHAAEEQRRILSTASTLGGARGTARVVLYEAMQRNVSAELHELLVAIGVAPHLVTAAAAAAEARGKPVVAGAPSSMPAELVKAGAENLADGLANFGEVESYLRPWPCLSGMLRADGPMLFAVDACAAELDGLPQALREEMARVKAARPRGWTLNESECDGALIT